MEFTYTRAKAALTEITFQVEYAPGPAGPWSSGGVTENVLTDDGTVQSVKALIPGAAASGGKLFAHLRVAR